MAVTAAGFKARFTEFASESDATVNLHLNDAAEEINRPAWGDKADRGNYYLAAHFLSNRNQVAGGGATAAGPIASEKLGPAARSYGITAYTSSATDTALAVTSYGREYMRQRDIIFASRIYGVE